MTNPKPPKDPNDISHDLMYWWTKLNHPGDAGKFNNLGQQTAANRDTYDTFNGDEGFLYNDMNAYPSQQDAFRYKDKYNNPYMEQLVNNMASINALKSFESYLNPPFGYGKIIDNKDGKTPGWGARRTGRVRQWPEHTPEYVMNAKTTKRMSKAGRFIHDDPSTNQRNRFSSQNANAGYESSGRSTNRSMLKVSNNITDELYDLLYGKTDNPFESSNNFRRNEDFGFMEVPGYNPAENAVRRGVASPKDVLMNDFYLNHANYNPLGDALDNLRRSVMPKMPKIIKRKSNVQKDGGVGDYIPRRRPGDIAPMYQRLGYGPGGRMSKADDKKPNNDDWSSKLSSAAVDFVLRNKSVIERKAKNLSDQGFNYVNQHKSDIGRGAKNLTENGIDFLNANKSNIERGAKDISDKGFDYVRRNKPNIEGVDYLLDNKSNIERGAKDISNQAFDYVRRNKSGIGDSVERMTNQGIDYAIRSKPAIEREAKRYSDQGFDYLSRSKNQIANQARNLLNSATGNTTKRAGAMSKSLQTNKKKNKYF